MLFGDFVNPLDADVFSGVFAGGSDAMEPVRVCDCRCLLAHLVAGALCVPFVIYLFYLHFSACPIGLLEVALIGAIAIVIIWIVVATCRVKIGLTLGETVDVETLTGVTSYQWEQVRCIWFSETGRPGGGNRPDARQSIQVITRDGREAMLRIKEAQVRQIVALLKDRGLSHLLVDQAKPNSL